MKKRSLALKIAVVVHAILLVVIFAGCPSRRESIITHIAPVPPDFNIIPPTIAPPPAHFQRLLPPDKTAPPLTQDSKSVQGSP